MKELSIEASIDAFVNEINEHTHGPVICWACGETEWNTFDETPVALSGIRLRNSPTGTSALTSFHVVALVCTTCGLLRFHSVRAVFPSEAP